MRDFARVAVVLLACIVALAAAWSKEDHEIFRLRDEVIASEGHNVTFYSFLGIKPNANQDDINKAYRKLSRTLHPDKAQSTWIANYNKPKVGKKGETPKIHVTKNKKPSNSEIKKFHKEASARFERLALITNVLRGSERARYDHFLYNGFPTWRGTGYYYERFRPGLGSVLFGLFIFVGGGVHYGFLYLTWKRQREFVQRYIGYAREKAWGDKGGIGAIPGLGGATNGAAGTQTPPDADDSMQWNRKQKREMERQRKKEGKNPIKSARAAAKARDEGISTPVEAEITSGPVGAKKRTVAENGKVLIVDSVGNVFLEEETEEGDMQEFLLDPDEIPPPTISNTWLVRLPVYLYNQSLGRALNKQTPEQIVYEAVQGQEGGEEQVDEGTAALNSAIPANANGESRKRKSKARS